MLGHQRGSAMVSQCRYAFRRHCSIKSGSFFLAEIWRMISSFRPRGTVSVSTWVTKPYLYSRLASSAIVLVAVVIVVPYTKPMFISGHWPAPAEAGEPAE